MKPHKAGGEVDAHCTKCKLELAHVIVAMVGPRIVRVQCKTCGSLHAFRGGPPTPRERRTSETASRHAATRPPPTPSDYERNLNGRDLSRARTYRPAIRFEPQDVVSHPTFGLGVVTRVLPDNKIEVSFPAGGKILVHARA